MNSNQNLTILFMMVRLSRIRNCWKIELAFKLWMLYHFLMAFHSWKIVVHWLEGNKERNFAFFFGKSLQQELSGNHCGLTFFHFQSRTLYFRLTINFSILLMQKQNNYKYFIFFAKNFREKENNHKFGIITKLLQCDIVVRIVDRPNAYHKSVWFFKKLNSVKQTNY